MAGAAPAADFRAPIMLGRSGLRVSRLGLGASYAAPTAAYEAAFAQGVNYFYWGSLRRSAMATAIRHLAPRSRDQLVVVLQSFARVGALVGRSIERGLATLGLDYADVLLLGWYNTPPSARVVEAALRLQARGLVHHLAISGHQRAMFPQLLDDPRFAIWHVRYNAVHRGAEREVFPHLTPRRVACRPGLVTYTTTRWGHLCDPQRTPPCDRTPTGTDCYRFALSHPAVDVVLAGPNDAAQMAQALQALDRGPMDAEELAWMRRVGDYIYGRSPAAGVLDRV
jgi:aryl-alcohol dehydrogenase-like predicted oxidoreductase